MSLASVRPARSWARWGAAFLLMVAYALSWADRTLPSILIEPMKQSLQVSDTQVALITGFAFALCHATLALPFSWVADRWDRARLITIGIVVWSCLTAACGFAPNFWSLFACRMGVGLGEALLLPAAYALIADLFSRKERPRALMIFVMGSQIGTGAALAGGGALHGWFQSAAPAWIGGLEPWRATFVVVGVIGLAVAALMLLLPEPRRHPGRLGEADEAPVVNATTAEFLAYLRKAAFFLVPLVGAVTLGNLYVNGFGAWLPPLFVRSYGWSLAQVGSALGLAILVTGTVGAPLAALLAGLLERWRKRDAAVTVLVIAFCGVLPLSVLSPLAPQGGTAFAGVVAALLLTMFATVVAPAAVVNSAPASMRARVSAVYLLIANLVGSGFGPAAYALVTDYVFRDPHKLYLSMAWVSAVLIGVSLLLLVIADRRYDRILRLSGEAGPDTPEARAQRV
jgi:MFS family permease